MEELNKIDGNAQLFLYLLTKDLKLLIKYLRFRNPRNPSLERCLKLVLQNKKHFYEDGLNWVDKSEELQGICALLNLIKLFSSEGSHVEDGSPESSDKLAQLLDSKPFLKSYFLEIKREQNVISSCSAKLKIDLPASKLVGNCGLLQHLGKYLVSENFNYDDIKNLLQINIEANEHISEVISNPRLLIARHETVLIDQHQLIKLFLEKVLFENNKADDTINRMKNILKSVKDLNAFNEVIQMLFHLLFLRNEDVKSTDTSDGFLCNQIAVEKLLNFLKISQLQKIHSKEYATAEAGVQSQFDQQHGHIEDALWVLSLFNGQKSELPQAMVANLKSTSLFFTVKAQHSSSDDDEKVSSKKYSTYPRKRLPKKKVPLKSDGTGSATSNHHHVSSSFPNHEDEQMPPASINIMSKMLASPESLMAMCLHNNDLGNVKQIIKTFKLENSPLNKNLTFIENFNTTKSTLKSIITKFEQEKRLPKPDHQQSMIETITKVTVLGFEASKIINKLETFVSTNGIVHDEETLQIIEKHKNNFPLLAQSSHEPLSTIIDMTLSLSCGHDLNLNLHSMMKLLCNKPQDGNSIGYHRFIENIMGALSCHKTMFGRDYIEEILTNEFHKLDVQVLPQKLELEKCITSFLLNDKVNYAKTGQNKLQRLLPLKSLNRVQAFMKNVEEVLKFLSSPVAVGGKSEILVMNLNGIVGELIFNSGLQPDVVENLAKSVNLNFVHSLTVNCLPKIYIHQPINTETDRNVLNRFYNCLDDEQLPLNEAASLFTLDDKCQLTLNYVQTTNETIAYLLSEIFNVPLSQEHSRLEYTFFKNLMLSTRVETNVRSALYSSKAFAALSFDRIAMSKLCDLLAQSTSNPNGQVIEILENITEIQYRQHSDILNSIKDSCLLKIIFNPSMSVEKYAYISKITDYNVRADTVLKCLVKIKSVDLAERLIKDLLVTLSVHKPPPSAKSAEYREKLQSWHENIVVYKSIAESIENNYNWIDVMEQSTNNPENILQHLLERKQYQLCLQWTAIHPLRELKQRHVEILEKFSSALLVDQDTDCNPVLIKIIESSLPHQRIIEFYDNLILTSEWKNLQLLNDFLKYAAANKHSTKICPKKIQKYKLSLVIFEIVGEGEYKGLWKLINKPLLIIEQYLMNSKFAVLARIIEQIRPIVGKKPNQLCKLCNVHSSDSLLCLEPVTASKFMSAHKSDFITTACVDTLIRIYAATALDFRVAEKRSLRTSSSHNTTEMSSLDSLCDDFVLPKVVPKKENWVDDYAVTHCMCCKRVPFTMLTRRHHCRRCGRVVCHSCSTQRLKIPEIYSDILVRCCDDCYRSTELALKKTRSPRTINTDSMFDHKFLNVEPEEDEWILSGNTKYDCLLRDEFVYEYAPSVSLCLSICAFHSTTNNVECVNFLLLHCRKLQSVLGPIQAGIPNPEVDYVLVTKMLNCLILATKVRGGEPNECNAMIDYAEIITSVVQNGCQHLLQIEPLDSSTLRRLCDSLVRADKWKLALELSLKCGFPITGIKASWGVSCLKAGCYATAREKLSYCMQKIDDENLKNLNSLLETTLDVKGLADVVATKRPLKSPPLLLEVLKVLESNRCDQQKPELMKRASSITSSNLLLATQKMKRKENIPMNEPALSILDAISNLKQITKGVYTNELKTIRSDNPMLASFRDYLPQINITKTRFYEESMYYLISYGCHSDIVRFLMKNKLISYALKYILLQKVDPSTFIHVVFMPNVKQGNVASIIDLMTEIDETMLIWRDYITQTCRYLEVNRLLNTLYQLQNLLQDPIRASMTSVKFYSMQCSSFLDLQTNTFHLINAKKHLQSELELCNWEEIKLNDNSAPVKDDSLSMKMDLKTLNGHINTINRQIEIVKFLAACEQKNGADAMRVLSKIFLDVPHLPTLFGKVNEKIQLAVLTLVCGKNVEEGFGLSFRIIQDFNLNSTKIYGLTAKYLASSNRIVEVEKLMECIKSNDADKEPVMKICDEIACLAVKTAIETYGMKIKSSLDNLIKSVCDTETKVQCFIWLGQLKSAYLLAVQHNRLSDVKKILRQAEKTNQPHIKRLCEKKLNLNTMCHTHVRDFLRY